MKQYIQELIEENEYQATRLLQILREIQSRYYHIPNEAIEQTAELLQVPRTRIISVIEFYSFFHLHPRGQYDILISDSITDHMLGKHQLTDYMCKKLAVNIGEIRDDGLVSLDNASCTGMCDQGPAGLVNGYALPRLNKKKIDQIADLIKQKKPLEQWPEALFQVEDNIKKPGLLLTEKMAPGDSLKATFAKGLSETLDEIDQSDLRGRGGAGFKTATKWRFCADEQQAERYVVCNADEGEPGTFKDRILLNTYAHQVFEGMTLCAAIIGAKQGFLYLRGEYLYLYDNLQQILQQRRQQNLLGKGISERDFVFDIEIRLGAGAYICGEESALIESLEGKRGMPRNRPPYPVSCGYLGKPTVVNNVETFVAAAGIAVHGGAWFASSGTAQSKGTKLLSISGDCEGPGIYEYVFGTTAKQILSDCGANDVLGVQVGGPSGTFISENEFDRKLAFEDLATGGSFIVFNKQRNILDIVHNFTHFFAHESCGFCTPCRVGTALLKKQLDKIYDGHGSAGDVVELEKLGQLIKNTSHCGLGQTAANPILTTLERYPELYERLLKEISYEPGFDLDASLETARQLTERNDAGAHLSQTGE
jgi:[NiFe] hydrogenase diaphorase moiety large subunit